MTKCNKVPFWVKFNDKGKTNDHTKSYRIIHIFTHDMI